MEAESRLLTVHAAFAQDAERRAIEIIADGKPATGFMRFGDTVRMEAQSEDGRAPFGAIEQQVVKHTG